MTKKKILKEGEVLDKGGRPSKYEKIYCDQVIAIMREGASKKEFCADIGISYPTFIKWQQDFPEFLASVKMAETLCQAWWEKAGRKATFNSEGFNATCYIFNMKNRFKDDWRDKQEVESTISAKIEVKQISDEKLTEALKQFGFGRESNQLEGKLLNDK